MNDVTVETSGDPPRWVSGKMGRQKENRFLKFLSISRAGYTRQSRDNFRCDIIDGPHGR